jgi:tetratricopeptide (TPR) repeat protein
MNGSIIAFIKVCLALCLASSMAYASDMCPLAKELAARSLKTLETDKQKGLAGLIQAQKYCPEDADIAYDLGLAYYKYKRPDMAYTTWSGLAKGNPRDLKLMANLGWLALELGKLDEAASWGKRAAEIKSDDPNALALQVEVLFRRGKYPEALSYAYAHKSNLPAEYLEKTAEYAAEAQWNVFRSGGKEEATQEMLRLSQQYPGVRQFQEAKDKMVAALLSDTADIPLPKPLPDQQRPPGGQFVAPESEVLKIQSARRTLDPKDDAYALIVGIRRYRDLNGPRFADNDARQVQRLITKMAGFRNDPAHTRLRLDNDATIGTLYGDLHWLLRKAKLNPDAKILFYFSGHGSPVLGDDKKTIKDGLLVPYEASLDNLNDRTAVSLAFLKKELGGLPNRDVVCVIDACFSGSGKSVSGMKLIKPEVDVNLLSSNKLFISASAADRPAEEYTPGQQGAFTYFFLKGLMGDGDDNEDGWVDTREAYAYACAKLKALGLEQNPQMSSKTAIRVTRVK